MKKKILYGVITAACAAAVILTLILLIPLERKNKLEEKYGELAVNAETDEKSAYILENIDMYPDELLHFYYQDYDKNIEFLVNYPEHKNDYAKMSFTEEELHSDAVPALYMSDMRWRYERIGNSFIEKDGCAFVSLTMAYLYLTHKSDIDPQKIARIAYDMDAIGFVGGLESDRTLDVIEAVGFTAVEHNYTEGMEKVSDVSMDEIMNALDSGKVLMAGMVSETFGNHAIIIRECHPDGTIYINDPADEEKTAKKWSFDELQPDVYYMWELSVE